MKKNRILKRLRICLVILIFLSRADYVNGQDENLEIFNRWIEWTDGRNMLVHRLNDEAFTLLDNRDDAISRLRTKEDWMIRQKNVKDILMKIVGPFPGKTPLNAKITGVVKKDGYRIEKVIYESMPAFYVTGCLFIPDDAKEKRPAILFVSGHTQNSFRYPEYQVMILNLVKKGFIVFAIDPVSQGERIQHYDAEKNSSVIGPTTREHNYLGDQCFVSGVSLGRYFIWDGIRGIDYLLTRREVDPARIGVTGQSGGGTQSSYIFAFDERIKAAAPVNYITGFRRLLESIGPQDAEQNFYHGILNGITHADLLEVRAPVPALIVAGTRDFFSIQGARETYSEVRNSYVAFGMEDNFGILEDDWGHGYTKKLREGVCAFFQKNLNLPGNPEDENVKVSDPEELLVTETGNVASSFENAETVFSINKRETQKLIDKIEVSRKRIEPHMERVQLKAKELSGYLAPDAEVKSVFRGRYPRDGYSVEMYALEGEGDCIIPMLLFIPEKGSKFSSVIYIHPEGKIPDAAPGGKIEQLVKSGYLVAAPDLIGTGETAGNGNVAMLIGRSVVGIQAGDIVRVVNYLKSRNDIDTNKIGAIAFSKMCPVLLHAAAFEKSIHSVTLIGPLISYKTYVMNKYYDIDFCNNYVAGALTAYDLPDLIGCIAPRRICLADIKDQLNKNASTEQINEDLIFPRFVYSQKDASNNINIVTQSGNLNSIISLSFKE
jgi:cephalosporin-C deacetylase-like acetyl esterase